MVYNKKELLDGFTLAEVLITLGIIGVVAALTMPVIIKGKERKELETGFKKQYSVLQNAFTRLNQIANLKIVPKLTVKAFTKI